MGSDTFGDRSVGDPDKHPLSARAVAANAASKKRGTGYTARHATWEHGKGIPNDTYPIDRSARPWGPDGGPYLHSSTLAPTSAAGLEAYWRRYAGGSPNTGWGSGAWGEALGENLEALKRWYAAQPPEHQALWDGEPTVEEGFDAALSNQYPSAFYGGGSEILIDSAQAWDAHRFLLNAALAAGELHLGEVWSIKLVGDNSPTSFLIQWMPGTVTPPPPPPPDEEEDDAPPPPPPPPPVEMKFERLTIPPPIADTMAKIGGWIPPNRPKLRKRAKALGAWLSGLELYVRVK